MQYLLELIRGGGRTTTVPLTLNVSNWITTDSYRYEQSISVPGILADESKQFIQIIPAIEDQKLYLDTGVYVSAQATNKLTFMCHEMPTCDFTIYVVIQEA